MMMHLPFERNLLVMYLLKGRAKNMKIFAMNIFVFAYNKKYVNNCDAIIFGLKCQIYEL